MCHLILGLPLFALPLFWLLPLGIAAPLYGALTALATLVYYAAWRTERRPVRIGRERLYDAIGTVAATQPSLRIRIDGDTWPARSREPLAPGESVRVVALDGCKLRVCRVPGNHDGVE